MKTVLDAPEKCLGKCAGSAAAKAIVKMVVFAALLLAMISGCYVGGAAFLIIRDTPIQADAVVLFIGPDYEQRRREARRLIEDGYARVMLVPALDGMWTSKDGEWVDVVPSHLQGQGSRFDFGQYPRYYENTHIEVLTALKMMADAQLSSAVFVSSPTHMRRIRIITKYVVPDTTRYQIIFRGTRYIAYDNVVSFFHPVNAKQIVLEYIKIGWFCLYHSIAKK